MKQARRPTPTANWSRIRSALAEPNYRLFTAGNAASLVGLWAQRVAIGWIVWEMTGSSLWLGFVAMADLFPMVLIAPFAGVYADRMDRLMTTRISQGLLALQGAALFGLAISGAISASSVLALTLFGGVVTAFNQPARMALLPALITRENLTAAIAMNSVVFNTARFIGPALAGLVLATVGAAWAFLLAAMTYVVFVLTLMAIQPREPDQLDETNGPILRSLADGVLYASGHRGLAGMFLSLLVVSLFARPLLELLPSYAANLDLGASGFAFLTAIIGLGSVIGGLWLAGSGDPCRLARLAFVNGFIASSALGIAALTASAAIAVLALLVLGFSMVVSGIASQTLIQANAEPHLRGRLLSLHSVIFRGGPALGALLIGAVADAAGLRPALLGAATACFLLSLALWRHRHPVWNSFEPGT